MKSLFGVGATGLFLVVAACGPPPPPPPEPVDDAGESDAGADPWAGADPTCMRWSPEMMDGGSTFVDGGALFDLPDGGQLYVGPAAVAPLYACFTTRSVVRTLSEAYPATPLPKEKFLGCSQATPAGCPSADAGVLEVPSTRLGSPRPFNPFDPALLPTPDAGECPGGTGWSFESGTYAGWTPSGAFANEPVYGNNVAISRIRPPGFSEDPAIAPGPNVGGDYWEFSQDIHPHGDYWAGSGDVRAGWWVRPGGRTADALGGTLTSEPFKLSAPYLTFRIGGARTTDERVELLILSIDAADQLALKAAHQGLGNVDVSIGPAIPLTTTALPGWVVVRSATSHADQEYLQRLVVWDVAPFAGRVATLRVVDEAGAKGHVNVDEFRCEQKPPEGTTWLPFTGTTDPSKLGEVITPLPLWGVTDVHSHVVDNLTLGGHWVWADPADDLANLYDCNLPLPAITTRDGGVVRKAIAQPNVVEECYVSADIVGLITAAGLGACTVASGTLGLVPFVGPVLAGLAFGTCSIALTAAATALLTAPSLEGRSYHGGEMPTGGGFSPGPIISFLMKLLDPDTETDMPGLIETLDWDQVDGKHSGHGLGYMHQRYHASMIRRAYLGGLRLIVIDAINNRAMQYAIDGEDSMDDWTALRLSVESVKRLTASDTDATYFPGPLRDFAQVAYTPKQVRDIIASNKLAIILGSEVPELGKLRPEVPGDSIEQQVADLFAMGIRKVTPIHGLDSPLGGTGLFNDIYNSGSLYLNLTRDGNGAAAGTWTPLLPIPVGLPPLFPHPFSGLSLGSYQVMDLLKPNAPCAGGAGCAWNLVNDGWFRVTSTVGGPTDFIGETDQVQFRVGIEEARNLEKVRAPTAGDPGNLWNNPDLRYANRLDNLGWLLGRGPGGVVPSRRCSMDHMFFPLLGNLSPAVLSNYRDTPRHLNDRGLTPEGVRFARAMMEHAFLVDSDHLSQKSRLDLHAAAATFRAESGSTVPEAEYPIFGIHTDLRRYGKKGPIPNVPELRDALGWGAETDKTVAEARRIRENGGTIAASWAGGVVTDPDALVGNIRNNCDYTNKTVAMRYLEMVRVMGGHGVTGSTDMNSPSPRVQSRFGARRACFSNDIPQRLADKRWHDNGEARPYLASWPRDWTTEFLGRCEDNQNKPSAAQNPVCPSTKNPLEQFEEFSGVEYDDYAARPKFTDVAWRPAGRPELQVVVARDSNENRDDAPTLARVPESVAYGGGGALAQGRPMKKFKNPGAAGPAAQNAGWDVNLDGVTNLGLLPDSVQDMRNFGVTWEQLTPMFNSGEDFVRMWEKACKLQRAWHTAHGSTPPLSCD